MPSDDCSEKHPEPSYVVNSCFVLGESVMSVVCLFLRTYGIGVVSCWGCDSGMCHVWGVSAMSGQAGRAA